MEKNRIKEKTFFNKNNHDLIMELKEKGISNKNILSTIKKPVKIALTKKNYLTLNLFLF